MYPVPKKCEAQSFALCLTITTHRQCCGWKNKTTRTRTMKMFYIFAVNKCYLYWCLITSLGSLITELKVWIILSIYSMLICHSCHWVASCVTSSMTGRFLMGRGWWRQGDSSSDSLPARHIHAKNTSWWLVRRWRKTWFCRWWSCSKKWSVHNCKKIELWSNKKERKQ
jgi:hypothetical protein